MPNQGNFTLSFVQEVQKLARYVYLNFFRRKVGLTSEFLVKWSCKGFRLFNQALILSNNTTRYSSIAFERQFALDLQHSAAEIRSLSSPFQVTVATFLMIQQRAAL